MSASGTTGAASERASASRSDTKGPPMGSCDADASALPPRLFILCGRDRKAEELREMFARCGTIRHLHIATDRSNKSRGFAFLQYENPSCASEAIKQFDQMTLTDGHVLKVTVAREKSAVDTAATTTSHKPGKLKRNQHYQEELEAQGDEGSHGDGTLPGKRQRSSPPSSATLPPSVFAWKKRPTAPPPPVVAPPKRSVEDEVSDIIKRMVSQLERMYEDHVAPDKPSSTHSSSSAAAKRKAPTPLTSVTVDGNCKSRSTSGSGRIVADAEEMKQKSQRTTAQATPNRFTRQAFTLRHRRHVSIDDSDSSVDEASDASIGRRKRSSTEPEDEGDRRPRKDRGNAEVKTRRRLSDLSELSLSPAGISSPSAASKKARHRRTSASSTSSSILAMHAHAPVFFPLPSPPPVFAPSPIRRKSTSTTRSRLFFTSTYKFTEQEVEAMFSIYDHFEGVELVKSFGRVKTMAYIQYTTPSAASSVLTSFLEDNEGEDVGMIKLVFAEPEQAVGTGFASNRLSRPRATSTAGESTASEPVHPVSVQSTIVPSQERCWVMVLYDRGLTNEAISSCVTACEGMEFMDIKMVRSTGESQGVAFVKFESEEFAAAASKRLHNSEFPESSRKFLQAIVIADPSVLSTPHSANASHANDELDSSLPHHTGEDCELGVVEARFAHLMSGAFDQSTPTHAVPIEEGFDSRAYGSSTATPTHYMGSFDRSDPPTHPSGPHYGFFQFGQPYPYTSPRQQYPGFYPPPLPHNMPIPSDGWGYHHDSCTNSWPGGGAYHATGRTPRENFNQFDWESTAHISSQGVTAHHKSDLPVSEAASIYISSARPLDLSSLMKAIQEYEGVVGFSKEERDGIAFVVDFAEPQLAVEAASKLDGAMCDGHKLRAAVATGSRAPPSRRKRQRVDQRGRRK